MKFGKLAALSLIALCIVFASCVDDDVYDENTYVGSALPMSGSQEVPSVTTTATGYVTVSYSKLSKTLSYMVTFSGLSGNVISPTTNNKTGISGTAEPGINGSLLQSFGGFPTGVAASYSGTLFFDGVKINETDLLAGKYYINLATTANPNGEIRGQLVLTKK